MHNRVWATAVRPRHLLRDDRRLCGAQSTNGCARNPGPLQRRRRGGGPPPRASVAASAPVSAVASPASSDAGEVTSSELQSPASLESVASSSTPTNLCPLLTAPAVAALLPNAEGGGPYGEDQGVPNNASGKAKTAFSRCLFNPAAHLGSHWSLGMRSKTGQLAEHPTWNLQHEAHASSSAAGRVVLHPRGCRGRPNLWHFADAAHMVCRRRGTRPRSFIGGPSRPDETTALVALATTLTAAAEESILSCPRPN